MKVLLLRNVGETQNLSMKLYADKLTHVLDGRCAVDSFRPWTPPTSPRSGLRVPFKALEYLARYVVYPASLCRQAADVYHVVDHAYGHLLLPLPLRRTVVTCHDVTMLRLATGEFGPAYPRYPLAAALLQFSVGFLRQAAVVVTVSQATAEDVVSRLGVQPERIRVIPHGVDPLFQPPPNANSRRRAREQLVSDERPLLLHIGNNWFYKNLEGILEAMALLTGSPTRHAPVLLKVGMPLTPTQREQARRIGVLERVHEAGFLCADELLRAYWAADLLVFPSLWEGFGWPVLEAMACGTPVICSDRGGLGEVAGEAAVIVDPEDPRAIARGIERVLEDQALSRELAARGFEWARAFTWARAADALYGVYQSVANGMA